METYLRRYEILYAQTLKLAIDYSTNSSLYFHNSGLLDIVEQKFFTLLGSQPGSLYITEKYVNSPQSQFVTEELAKIQTLGGMINILPETFATKGVAVLTDPQFPSGSASNRDYIYGGSFATQYSYSVTIPFLSDGYSTSSPILNMYSPIKIGLSSGYAAYNDTNANQSIMLRCHLATYPGGYYNYIQYELHVYGHAVSTVVGSIVKVAISYERDHVVSISSSQNGISFLINGIDHWGAKNNSNTPGFDVTQPMSFFATPSGGAGTATSSDCSISVIGYTKQIFQFSSKFKTTSNVTIVDNVVTFPSYPGPNDQLICTPSSTYASYTVQLPEIGINSSMNIGLQSTLTGGKSIYVRAENDSRRVHYLNLYISDGISNIINLDSYIYQKDDILRIRIRAGSTTGIEFFINGTSIFAGLLNSGNNYSFNDWWIGFPFPLYFFIVPADGDSSSVVFPYIQRYFPFEPLYYITSGTNPTISTDYVIFSEGVNSTNYLTTNIPSNRITYTVTLPSDFLTSGNTDDDFQVGINTLNNQGYGIYLYVDHNDNNFSISYNTSGGTTVITHIGFQGGDNVITIQVDTTAITFMNNSSLLWVITAEELKIGGALVDLYLPTYFYMSPIGTLNTTYKFEHLVLSQP